jgi:glyoxylate reductase
VSERVYVTYPIPGPGLEMLRDKFEVEVFGEDLEAGADPDHGLGIPAPAREQLIASARECAGLLTLVRDRVDDDLLSELPSLKIVANYGVGYDNIDVTAATRHRVMVTNTPGVLTDATADLAWTLMLASARRVVEGERMMRTGAYHGWDPKMLVGADVFGQTLGVVGFGRIGQAVARRARGFDMRILYEDAVEMPQAKDLGATRVDLDTILAESDFISLHVALTPETHHLIGEAQLRRMKPTAHLVNTSRGPVIDEAALVRALREGWIAGAGLDVFEREPELSPGLAELGNVVLLPHLGSATKGSRAGMSRLAAENVIAALGGERPPTIVNPEVLGPA